VPPCHRLSAGSGSYHARDWRITEGNVACC
jgi:hypothetical protein